MPPVNDMLLLAGWLLAVAIAAEATRIHAERAAATRASRQIDQRRRQSEERLRIARDLHDVIGHNISLINVQASMGLDLMDSQPEQARAALSAIKSASKEAPEELRTMLTNVARHAGRARVTVRVTYLDADVYIEIDDDGPAPSPGAAAIGTGSGIMGMRERATALGGNLCAGFRRGGGFQVSARLPVRSSR
jgi:signal transduction histidine kinase